MPGNNDPTFNNFKTNNEEQRKTIDHSVKNESYDAWRKWIESVRKMPYDRPRSDSSQARTNIGIQSDFTGIF